MCLRDFKRCVCVILTKRERERERGSIMSTMSKKTPMQKNGTQNNGRKAASEREREREMGGRVGGSVPGLYFFRLSGLGVSRAAEVVVF